MSDNFDEELAAQAEIDANEAQDLADDLAIVAEYRAERALGVKTVTIPWERVKELHAQSV